MQKITSHDKIAKYTVIAILVLLPLVSQAGGLGIAPLAFIFGLIGLFLYVKAPEPKNRWSPSYILLVLFLIWLCVASLWSPYEPNDWLTNYIKLFVMGLVFYFCPVVFKQLSPSDTKTASQVFLTTTLFGALAVLVDIWSNFKVTLFFNPPSVSEDLGYRLKDAEMNLSSALTCLVLLSAPLIMILKNQVRNWKVISSFFVVAVIIASFLNNLWIGSIGIVAVLFALLLAHRFPQGFPKVLLLLSGVLILFAPVLAFISSLMIEIDLSAIPVSWEHRLRMWSYSWKVIIDNPMFGNGFDAARTYSETWTTRNDIELSIVSLHPHNAGIHIWTEAGFIGALLATSLIISLLNLVKNITQDQSAIVSGIIVATLFIASLSYSAWNFWWWGCIFISIGLVHLVPGKT